MVSMNLPLLDHDGMKRREDELLAGYAMRSSRTRGRAHPEPEPRFRTCFQRDRDRIVHSTAFRRLEYKTQVFVNHEGDHFRTRLTHSIEVSQVARTVARALGLNPDLVEALALSHDLGHTPFGHLGEGSLDGEVVTCPWHGWRWNVKTGALTVDPSRKIETFKVTVEGQDIYVEA